MLANGSQTSLTWYADIRNDHLQFDQTKITASFKLTGMVP